MRLANNLSGFMYKQALSEEDVAQLVAAIQEAEAGKKKKKKDAGPNYGKRFLRGAALGAPYGGLVGGITGAGQGLTRDQFSPLQGAAIGLPVGALVGGVGGGLGNMLQAYLQGDLYDAIAASK